jgi:hypothetical protein
MRHYAASLKDAVVNPDITIVFNVSNSSTRSAALGSTQPPRGTIARSLIGGKGRPARKADNLTAYYENIV